MARSNICVILMFSSFFITTQIAGAFGKTREDGEAETLFQNICGGNEMLTKLHFYVQDVLSGDNRTVYEVARASITSNSVTGFGQVRVLDDLVTAGPGRGSPKLGRAQGLITFSDLETSALTMDLNVVFTAGKYNGSTICILGRNQIANQRRELAVVGGTGAFRFARGYAISSTFDYNTETSYGILEYTIYTTRVVDRGSNVRVRIADM